MAVKKKNKKKTSKKIKQTNKKKTTPAKTTPLSASVDKATLSPATNEHITNASSLFRDTFLLIVSLLHGSLFFVLGDKTINIINAFNIIDLSRLIFFYSLFFRVFQTHLLAAVKYNVKWTLNPLDFIMVFMTSLFEYLLFSHEKIVVAGTDIYNSLIMFFCLFGFIGYIFTYLKTYKNFDSKEQKTERRIQIINIVCIAVVGILHVIYYYQIVPTSLPI